MILQSLLLDFDHARSGGQEDARKRALRSGLVAARNSVPQVAQCCVELSPVLRRLGFWLFRLFKRKRW